MRIALCLLCACSYTAPNGIAPPDDDAATPDTPVVVPDGQPDTPPSSNARQKTITVDAGRVTGTQNGFAVWVVLEDNDLKSRARPDGADIHFTRGGQPLPYERQRWVAATGHLEAWVRVDLADVTDTAFEVRYGDLAIAHAPNPTGVFGDDFAAVWHLEDKASVADAHGAVPGTAVGGTNTAGKLGGGIGFGGTSEIQFTNPYAGNDAHTISAWVSSAAPAQGFGNVITVGNSATNQARFLHTRYNSGLGFGMFGNDHTNAANIDDDGYTLVHWVYTPAGNGGISTLFVDGNLVATENQESTVNTQGNAGHLGLAPQAFGPGGNTLNPLNGSLDEVRLATTARSLGYISTEFANQSQPNTFYAVGDESMVP